MWKRCKNSPGLWPRACSDPSCLFATTHPFFLSCFFFLSAGPFSSFVACAYLGAVPWGPFPWKLDTRSRVFLLVSAHNRTLGGFFWFFGPLEKYHFSSSISAHHFSCIFQFYVDFGSHSRSILVSFLLLFTWLFRSSFFHVFCFDFDAIFIPFKPQKACFYYSKNIVFTKSPFRD